MAAPIRVRLVLLALLLASLGLEPAVAARSRGQVGQARLTAIPLGIGDVTGGEDRLDDEIGDVLRPSQTLNRRYRHGEHDYWLSVGYFTQQRLGGQIHSPRYCYPVSGWNILSATESERLGGPSGELLIERERERRVVCYQYLTRGGATTSGLRLKLELMVSSLLGRPRDAAFVRYSTAVGPGESEAAALERLGAFARVMQPTLRPALPF